MKKLSFVATATLALLLGVWLVVQRDTLGERDGERNAEAIASPTRVTRDQDGRTTITLDAETRRNLAIEVRAAEPASMLPEIRGYGRVLDPTPLIELTAAQAMARVAVDGAAKELRRVQVLATDQNASARSVEAAETALAQAEISLDAAHGKLQSAWGAHLAERSDLAELSRQLAAGAAVLVRIDLPAGENLDPTGVRLLTLADPPVSVAAELIGPAPSVDPQLQGSSFVALISPNAAPLVPGQAVIGLLARSTISIPGVIVPRSAVVRSDGRAWIYVSLPADVFERRALVLDQPMPDGWFVSSGISANDVIVLTGAQMLLSEELKSTVTDSD